MTAPAKIHALQHHLMHIMSIFERPDSARDVQDLVSRFESVAVDDTYDGDYTLDDPYTAFDDTADISNYYLGSTTDPFEDNDIKYRFDVYRIAIGCMDGRQLNFYEVRIPILSLRRI